MTTSGNETCDQCGGPADPTEGGGGCYRGSYVFCSDECEIEHWKENWTCPNCGSGEPHDAILVADGEIEVDVTCESVYLTFVDDDVDHPGMVFSHDQFEEIIEHYEEATDGV